jgi:hypothetical protein
VGRVVRLGDIVSETIEGMAALNKRLAATGDTRKFLGQLALMAVARAKQLVPRKTGNLGRTIRLGQVTEHDAQIVAGGQFGVGYAQAVEYGSRPHDIVPRYKQVLAIPIGATRLSGSARSGSGVVFTKRVHHPGTKAQPYLMPAAQEVVSKSGIEILIKAWNDAA